MSLLGLQIYRDAPPSFVQNWADRVVANGGTIPGQATITAMSNFYNTLSQQGLASLIISMCVFVPDNLIAAITPFFHVAGNDPWTNHGFVASDLTYLGLQGDAASKYLDTGVIPSSVFAGATEYTAGMAILTTNQVDALNQMNMGCSDSLGNLFQFSSASNALGGFQTICDCWNLVTRINGSNVGWIGYLSMNRLAKNGSGAYVVYEANATTPHTAFGNSNGNESYPPPTTRSVYAFADDQNGTASKFCGNNMGVSAITYGFTAAQSSNFYSALATLLTALQKNIYVNHPLVTRWLANVNANGGAAPGSNTISALNTLCNSLDSAGITELMLTVNPFVPDNLIAATTPLLFIGANNPWTNHNFVGGDVSVNGMTGNGSTKFLDTGFNPAVWFNTTYGGLTLYTYTTNNNNETDAGASVGGGSFLLNVCYGGTTTYQDIFGTGGGRLALANAAWKGYTSGNRAATNSHAVYIASSTHAHSTLGSNTNTTSAPDSFSTFVFGADNVGSVFGPSSKTISFAAIHYGLTSAQSLAFYNAIQSYRTAIGGGYV